MLVVVVFVCNMCTHPIWIPYKGKMFDNRGTIGGYVPCGYCPECLKHRQNLWYVRFWAENKYQKRINPSSVTLFLTLTYNDEHLPSCRNDALNDIRAFVKQVSRKFNCKPRYYFASEHGDTHNRLHFHGLLFGVYLYCDWQKLIESIWPNGFVTVKVASYSNYRYVCKYVTKDMDPNENSDGIETIQVFSKRPSLGFNWITDTHKIYLNADLKRRLYIDGFSYSLPRSYSDKIYTSLNIGLRKYSCERFSDYDEVRDCDVRRKYDITKRDVIRKKMLKRAAINEINKI